MVCSENRSMWPHKLGHVEQIDEASFREFAHRYIPHAEPIEEAAKIAPRIDNGTR